MIKGEHIFHCSDSHSSTKANNMSKFPAWFNRAYKRWSRSQPGEEDFLAFCDLLGYSPSKVLAWLHGESVPEGPEVLSIAGVFGIDVYTALSLPKPDPELLKIFDLFSHLHGESRSRLALAILDAERHLQEYDISASSSAAKEILKNVFEKYGLDK
jgi:transcriptional regulator with XRE-family HTH domain